MSYETKCTCNFTDLADYQPRNNNYKINSHARITTPVELILLNTKPGGASVN